MALELKYSADQRHQVEAVESVTKLFRGQEFLSSEFVAEMGERGTLMENQIVQVGHANGLRLQPAQLIENLHAVQEEQSLPSTDKETDGRLRDFTIEMETGTGKTYVYTRTIYELNKQYGLTKFIIVVPSVAIREGVLKSFQSTKKHFDALYDKAPLDVFIYDSKDMGPVNNFATSSSIQVMIINISAFIQGYTEEGSAESGNLFHRPSEKITGGHSPRDLVASCNPIVIIDEPQSVDNTAKSKGAIRSLNPLFVLRYSATHKEEYNKVYRLTPVDAFQQKLVKGICVDSVLQEADLNGAYVKLESCKANPFSAKVTLDVIQRDGSKKRKSVNVKTGDDLYAKSNENLAYEDGWVVDNIGAVRGEEFIEFQNATFLERGAAVGDVSAERVKRAQIRRTIEDHLEKQLKLYHQGIKVLSLFFIDKVDRYRLYDPVRNGEYAEMFEEEYTAALATWAPKYKRAGVPLERDPKVVHEGYFAKDGKGKFKNTTDAASSEADRSTFELIMKERETLLSFPEAGDNAETAAKKRVQFIWSHSALKEGWDNPNVFQICTLVETKDKMTKQQKVGRGLRLCVDQNGERCYDDEVNVLTVIANESYDEFANGLQKDFEDNGMKFGVLTPESFTRVVITKPDGSEETLGYDGSKQVFDKLVSEGLVEKSGKVTEALKQAAEAGSVQMPEGMETAQEQVENVILHKAAKLQIRNKAKEVEIELKKDVSLSPEFQELWERIRQRTRFEVDVKSDEIITRSIEEINKMPRIKAPKIMSSRASLDIDESGVDAAGMGQSIVRVAGERVYDLPDPIGQLQDIVGLTRRTLKAILEGCSRMDEFEVDPATFLSQVAAKITKVKNEVVAQGIKYVKLPSDEWYTMRDLELGEFKAYEGQNAWRPTYASKCVYNYVVYDSSTVEQPFAVSLDKQEEVLVYAKLPAKFVIDTPLGTYNPDWAYVEEVDGEQRVYFVTETKGGKNGDPHLRDTERMKIECAEKHFAALELGDDFKYEVKTKFEVE